MKKEMEELMLKEMWCKGEETEATQEIWWMGKCGDCTRSLHDEAFSDHLYECETWVVVGKDEPTLVTVEMSNVWRSKGKENRDITNNENISNNFSY